jgi:hypothetical protein
LPCQDAIPTLSAVTDAGRDVDGDLRGYRNLLDCLAEVPQPRRRHGIRHRAAVVIVFAVAGGGACGSASETCTRALTGWPARSRSRPAARRRRMRSLCFCVMLDSWTTPRQTGRQPSSGRACTPV